MKQNRSHSLMYKKKIISKEVANDINNNNIVIFVADADAGAVAAAFFSHSNKSNNDLILKFIN